MGGSLKSRCPIRGYNDHIAMYCNYIINNILHIHSGVYIYIYLFMYLCICVKNAYIYIYSYIYSYIKLSNELQRNGISAHPINSLVFFSERSFHWPTYVDPLACLARSPSWMRLFYHLLRGCGFCSASENI